MLSLVTLFLLLFGDAFALRKTLEDVSLDLFPDYNFDTIENRYPFENQNTNHPSAWDNPARDNSRKALETQYNFEGIPHFEVIEGITNSKVSKEIEEAYRLLLSMKGVTAVYKRDNHWRTWRLVKYPEFKKVHCFVCRNNDNGDCGGFWSIEDRPPRCPYEILSMQSDDKVCYFNFNSELAPSECDKTISNLTVDCGNTIVTKWYFSIDYGDSREKPYLRLICSGLDPCEMTTVYEINNNQTKFKIVNKTNDIIYSRVMEKNNKNWACVVDCGKVNDRLHAFMPVIDKPLSINLLQPAHKAAKRENTHKTANMNTDKWQKKYNINIDKVKKKQKSFLRRKYKLATTTEYRPHDICEYIQCSKNKEDDDSFNFSNYEYTDQEDQPYLYFNS